MKNVLTIISFVFAVQYCAAQANNSITGYVIDKSSGQAIAGASVQLLIGQQSVATDPKGVFRLPTVQAADTLMISHVGYATMLLPLIQFSDGMKIKVEGNAVELRTVTINSRSFSVKEIDDGLRMIRGNLYAYERETTNALYNLFLSSLEENGSKPLLDRAQYQLSAHPAPERLFYEKYVQAYKGQRNKKDTTERDYSSYPAVNISHEGAVLFCEWLTTQYNSANKRKFKRVKFRLPTLQEWQIAALGDYEFQSWNLDENFVSVIIPDDTISISMKGPKTSIPVGNNNVWYPWHKAYNYRKKPVNHMNCYLANFKVDEQQLVCNNIRKPGGDGWVKMAKTASYFPNNVGLYDVVGNVAEMIDEPFKACGGSWNDSPQNSTIRSVKTYRKPNDTIGFRFFMEVEEK